MKNCPVCKTAVFDDMDVCYGCMHRFSVLELEGGAMLRIENGAELEAGFEAASVREIEKGAPTNYLRQSPLGWKNCRVRGFCALSCGILVSQGGRGPSSLRRRAVLLRKPRRSSPRTGPLPLPGSCPQWPGRNRAACFPRR